MKNSTIVTTYNTAAETNTITTSQTSTLTSTITSYTPMAIAMRSAEILLLKRDIEEGDENSEDESKGQREETSTQLSKSSVSGK